MNTNRREFLLELMILKVLQDETPLKTLAEQVAQKTEKITTEGNGIIKLYRHFTTISLRIHTKDFIAAVNKEDNYLAIDYIPKNSEEINNLVEGAGRFIDLGIDAKFKYQHELIPSYAFHDGRKIKPATDLALFLDLYKNALNAIDSFYTKRNLRVYDKA
nr:hypothetical protein [Candidatus Woesearchaeota archaeon]